MKKDTLIPAIVQDETTGRVLMMAYVNEESLAITRETGKMTFYSRSRQRLWTKGEESGNYLYVKEILEDCDNDTLLVKAVPTGPACHTGTDTCWGESNERFGSWGENSDRFKTRGAGDILSDDPLVGKPAPGQSFTAELERVIEERRGASPESSYTAKLLAAGPRRIAKKLGEESAELIIESMDTRDDLFLNEAADLLYHFLVLVHSRGYALKDVEDILRLRHR